MKQKSSTSQATPGGRKRAIRNSTTSSSTSPINPGNGANKGTSKNIVQNPQQRPVTGASIKTKEDKEPETPRNLRSRKKIEVITIDDSSDEEPKKKKVSTPSKPVSRRSKPIKKRQKLNSSDSSENDDDIQIVDESISRNLTKKQPNKKIPKNNKQTAKQSAATRFKEAGKSPQKTVAPPSNCVPSTSSPEKKPLIALTKSADTNALNTPKTTTPSSSSRTNARISAVAQVPKAVPEIVKPCNRQRKESSHSSDNEDEEDEEDEKGASKTASGKGKPWNRPRKEQLHFSDDEEEEEDEESDTSLYSETSADVSNVDIEKMAPWQRPRKETLHFSDDENEGDEESDPSTSSETTVGVSKAVSKKEKPRNTPRADLSDDEDDDEDEDEEVEDEEDSDSSFFRAAKVEKMKPWDRPRKETLHFSDDEDEEDKESDPSISSETTVGVSKAVSDKEKPRNKPREDFSDDEDDDEYEDEEVEDEEDLDSSFFRLAKVEKMEPWNRPRKETLHFSDDEDEEDEESDPSISSHSAEIGQEGTTRKLNNSSGIPKVVPVGSNEKKTGFPYPRKKRDSKGKFVSEKLQINKTDSEGKFVSEKLQINKTDSEGKFVSEKLQVYKRDPKGKFVSEKPKINKRDSKRKFVSEKPVDRSSVTTPKDVLRKEKTTDRSRSRTISSSSEGFADQGPSTSIRRLPPRAAGQMSILKRFAAELTSDDDSDGRSVCRRKSRAKPTFKTPVPSVMSNSPSTQKDVADSSQQKRSSQLPTPQSRSRSPSVLRKTPARDTRRKRTAEEVQTKSSSRSKKPKRKSTVLLLNKNIKIPSKTEKQTMLSNALAFIQKNAPLPSDITYEAPSKKKRRVDPTEDSDDSDDSYLSDLIFELDENEEGSSTNNVQSSQPVESRNRAEPVEMSATTEYNYSEDDMEVDYEEVEKMAAEQNARSRNISRRTESPQNIGPNGSDDDVEVDYSIDFEDEFSLSHQRSLSSRTAKTAVATYDEDFGEEDFETVLASNEASTSSGRRKQNSLLKPSTSSALSTPSKKRAKKPDNTRTDATQPHVDLVLRENRNIYPCRRGIERTPGLSVYCKMNLIERRIYWEAKIELVENHSDDLLFFEQRVRFERRKRTDETLFSDYKTKNMWDSRTQRCALLAARTFVTIGKGYDPEIDEFTVSIHATTDPTTKVTIDEEKSVYRAPANRIRVMEDITFSNNKIPVYSDVPGDDPSTFHITDNLLFDYIHENIVDKFTEKLLAEAVELSLGPENCIRCDCRSKEPVVECYRNPQCPCYRMNKAFQNFKPSQSDTRTEFTSYTPILFNDLTTPFYKRVGFGCSKFCHCKGECDNNPAFHVDKGTFPLEIYRQNEELGYGIRSTTFIPAGLPVMEFCGEIVELRNRNRNVTDYSMQLTDPVEEEELNSFIRNMRTWSPEFEAILDRLSTVEFHIDCKMQGNVSRVLNHSCTPNLEPLRIFERGVTPGNMRMLLYPTRDIAPGEPLTIDYGANYIRAKDCLCNTVACKRSPSYRIFHSFSFSVTARLYAKMMDDKAKRLEEVRKNERRKYDEKSVSDERLDCFVPRSNWRALT